MMHKSLHLDLYLSGSLVCYLVGGGVCIEVSRPGQLIGGKSIGNAITPDQHVKVTLTDEQWQALVKFVNDRQPAD